jgi:hypothetical protein
LIWNIDCVDLIDDHALIGHINSVNGVDLSYFSVDNIVIDSHIVIVDSLIIILEVRIIIDSGKGLIRAVVVVIVLLDSSWLTCRWLYTAHFLFSSLLFKYIYLNLC